MINLQLKNYELERAFRLFKQITDIKAGTLNAATHYKVLGLRNSLLKKANQYIESKPKFIDNHVKKKDNGDPVTKETDLGLVYVFKSKKDEEEWNNITQKAITISVDEQDLLEVDNLQQIDASLTERQILMKLTKRFAAVKQPDNSNEEEE